MEGISQFNIDISPTAATLFIALAVIVFVVLVVYTISSNYSKKYDTHKILRSTQAYRIIHVDMNNSVVKYFDKNDFSNHKKVPMRKFLLLYAEEDRVRIEKWFLDLIAAKKNVSDYLQVESIRSNKENTCCFLQVQEINKKHKTIYVESCVLENIRSRHTRLYKTPKVVVTNIDQMFMIDNYKDKKGGLFVYVFLKNNKIQDDDTDKVDTFLFANIKNLIIPHLQSNCSIADYSQSSFTIFFQGISTKNNAMRFMRFISRLIARYLDVHAYADNYDYGISGCLLNKDCSTYKQLVKATKSNVGYVIEHVDHIMLYDESNSTKDVVISYSDEVENFISKKDFNVLYQPVIDLQSGKLFAFVSSIVCNNTYFSDIQELKEQAFKVNKSKEIFGLISKKTIMGYRAEKVTQRLVYNVSVIEKDYIVKSLAHFSDVEKDDFILAFSEEELSQWLQEEESIVETFENLIDHGFVLALNISRKETLLTNEMMQKFSYFIITGELTRDCRKYGTAILVIHSLLDMLKSYKKNIIALDLDNTNSLYLLAKLGIKYATSSMIGAKDSMILKPDSKKVKKILSSTIGKK